MKRTAKILTVVLALAFVFASVALFAAAEEVDGVNVMISSNFENLDSKYQIAASQGNPAGTGYTWSLSGRSGKVSVALSEDGSENQYILIQNAPKAVANAASPYFGTGYGGKMTAGLGATTQRPTLANGILSLNGTDISEWPYLVMDLDIMAPSAKWYGDLTLELRTFLAGDTSLDAVHDIPVTKGSVRFRTDENGPFITDATETIKEYVSPYEFTHITLIYESVVTEATRAVNVHVYLNGEHFFTHLGDDIAEANGKSYYDNIPHMSFDEIRYNWTATDDKTLSTGIDNVVTRLFDSTYNGNLATVLDDASTLAAWESNIYKAEDVPFGVAVADVNGVKYDNLDTALAAAPENATLTLLADVPGTVKVNKLLTVNLNGFSADIIGDEGFAADSSTPGIVKIVNSVGLTTLAVWDDCYHDVICEDDFEINHPLAFDKELALGEKILAAYNPEYRGAVGTDGKLYVLEGWINVETGEMIDEDTAVTTDDLSAGFILLEPVYSVSIKTYEYVQNSVVKEVYDNTLTLKQVLDAADKNTVVKLYDDVEWANQSEIAINKTVTLDLNGHTLKALWQGSQSKKSIFSVGPNNEFTVTSSVAGGKIFNEGWNSKTSLGANGVFVSYNDTSVINIIGNDSEGNPTLAIFSGTILLGYQNAIEYHVDGGIFVSKATDQQGLFDVRKAGRDVSIKNAIFYTNHLGGVAAYAGRNTAMDASSNVTIDGCVFIGPAVGNVVDPVVITITNSYIYGDIKPAISSMYKTVAAGDTTGQANTPGKVILGAGNFIEGAINENVEIAEGVKLYDVATEHKLSYLNQDYVKGSEDFTFADESFVVTEVTKSFIFSKMTAADDMEFTKIIWKNSEGKVIGESEGLAGNVIIPPSDLEPAGSLVPGWLDYVPSEWNEELVVPEGVDEYVVTAKDGGAVVPVAALDLFFNIGLNTHFEYRIYIPNATDGVEITGVNFRGADRLANYKSLLGEKYTINGLTYTPTKGWPGVLSAANEASVITVTFTYEGKEYRVTRDINVYEYVNYILDFVPEEGQTPYSENAKILAVNTSNYIYKTLSAIGKDSVAEKFKAIVDNNTTRVLAIDKTSLPEVDLSIISKYVSGISLSITDYAPNFRFTLTEEGKAATVSFQMGATNETKEAYATLGYIDTANCRIQDLRRTKITITPAGEGAEPVSLTFSLEMYYALLVEAGAADAVLDVAEALWAYSKAEELY